MVGIVKIVNAREKITLAQLMECFDLLTFQAHVVTRSSCDRRAALASLGFSPKVAVRASALPFRRLLVVWTG